MSKYKGRPEVISQRTIFLLLEEHTRLEEGMAIYDEGWSDQRIADEAKVHRAAVAYRRVHGGFGHVVKGSNNQGLIQQLKTENERLRRQVLGAENLTSRSSKANQMLEDYDSGIYRPLRDVAEKFREPFTGVELVSFIEKIVDAGDEKKLTPKELGLWSKLEDGYDRRMKQIRRRLET